MICEFEAVVYCRWAPHIGSSPFHTRTRSDRQRKPASNRLWLMVLWNYSRGKFHSSNRVDGCNGGSLGNDDWWVIFYRTLMDLHDWGVMITCRFSSLAIFECGWKLCFVCVFGFVCGGKLFSEGWNQYDLFRKLRGFALRASFLCEN